MVRSGQYKGLGLLSVAKGNYPHIWSKGWSLPVRGFCLYVCNLADVVDRLLILTLCLQNVKHIPHVVQIKTTKTIPIGWHCTVVCTETQFRGVDFRKELYRTSVIYGLWGLMGICIDSIDILQIQAGIYGSQLGDINPHKSA